MRIAEKIKSDVQLLADATGNMMDEKAKAEKDLREVLEALGPFAHAIAAGTTVTGVSLEEAMRRWFGTCAPFGRISELLKKHGNLPTTAADLPARPRTLSECKNAREVASILDLALDTSAWEVAEQARKVLEGMPVDIPPVGEQQ